MARIPGRWQRLDTSQDGANYVEVRGITDATINMNQGEIKTTAHDDGDYDSYTMGRKDASIDVKLMYDEDDAGQNILNTAMINSAMLWFKLRMQDRTGAREYRFQAFCTKGSIGAPNDNAASYDTTLRVSGPMQLVSQP